MNSSIKTNLFTSLALGCIVASFRAESAASVSLFHAVGIVVVLVLFKSLSTDSPAESGQNKS